MTVSIDVGRRRAFALNEKAINQDRSENREKCTNK